MNRRTSPWSDRSICHRIHSSSQTTLYPIVTICPSKSNKKIPWKRGKVRTNLVTTGKDCLRQDPHWTFWPGSRGTEISDNGWVREGEMEGYIWDIFKCECMEGGGKSESPAFWSHRHVFVFFYSVPQPLVLFSCCCHTCVFILIVAPSYIFQSICDSARYILLSYSTARPDMKSHALYIWWNNLILHVHIYCSRTFTLPVLS